MSRSTLALCIATALWLPSAANATGVDEVEPNDSRATAQNLSASFSVDSVANIFNSTTFPHVSVSATNGSATDVDYYAITVANAGDTAFFDIDGAEGTGSPDFNMHTALALFDASGNLLAFDVNSAIDPGSAAPDSFVGSYTFAAPGTYYVGVTNGHPSVNSATSYFSAIGTLQGVLSRPDGASGGESFAGDSGPVDMTAQGDYDDGTYTLHVSLSSTPPPAGAAPPRELPIPLGALGLMALGLAGFGARRLHHKAG